MSFVLDDQAWRKDMLDFMNKHMPQEIEKELYKIANRLVDDIKENTNVITGTLRRNWFVSDIVREGNTYWIEVYNNTEYAEAVEFGHRRRGGKGPLVQGKFWMTTSLETMKKELPAELQVWLDSMAKLIAGV